MWKRENKLYFMFSANNDSTQSAGKVIDKSWTLGEQAPDGS